MADSKTKTNAKVPVIITKNYGLIADEREYTLYRLVTVDPTKAPGYKPKEGEPVPQVRTEWQNDDRHFTLNAKGLSEIVMYAVMRDVNDATEARTIAELLAEYTAALQGVEQAVLSAFTAGNEI